MNEAHVAEEVEVFEEKVPLTRDQIRAALIGKKHEGNSEIVTLFGVEIEFRQPTLGAILDAREDADEKTRTTDVFIKYAYVPGTQELVFEDTDRQTILEWPFNDDLIEVQKVVAKLTGIDLSDILAAEEELAENPLEG